MLSDGEMRRILSNARTIAVVGHSNRPNRTSYRIAKYLRRAGYTVYPVNPTAAEIDGERSYAGLADVPGPIDIVNVFRRSEHLAGIVEAAIDVGAKAIWAQLGVYGEAAAHLAWEAELPIVMNYCIKVAHQRLLRR